jgi:DNA-binding transcriptional ArsR family regulator
MKVVAVQLAAALADPTREAIVRLLIEGERPVGEIADRVPVSRPAVSRHLRVLVGAGVAVVRAAGTRRLYAVDPAALAALRDELDRMWKRSLARYAMVANNSPRAAARATRRKS